MIYPTMAGSKRSCTLRRFKWRMASSTRARRALLSSISSSFEPSIARTRMSQGMVRPWLKKRLRSGRRLDTRSCPTRFGRHCSWGRGTLSSLTIRPRITPIMLHRDGHHNHKKRRKNLDIRPDHRDNWNQKNIFNLQIINS